MRRRCTAALVLALVASLLVLAAPVALADHPAPGFSPGAPPEPGALSGGEDADWELIETFPTGNDMTDLEFFGQEGEIYVSAGTLGGGRNGGGQTILKLTEEGEVAPSFVSSHPSATCLSDPSAALGLQHDVEAAPKGNVIFNTIVGAADRRDAQLIIDATDARGRCHDQGVLGVEDAPRGGLELVDVTDVGSPIEIGLTSHIGQAHTVNVDPRRPHIAYSVTSDAVSVSAAAESPDGSDDSVGEPLGEDGERLQRENERPDDSDRFDLDGFEIVDYSSCMDFPEGTDVETKREQCRPEVFRYRFPTLAMQLGHSNTGLVYGCHELEIYPNDRLACGSGNALLEFDMSGVFDDRGTPEDFSDDTLRGEPLDCTLRESSSEAGFATGAMITDCTVTPEGAELSVAQWLIDGAPSLEGVEHLGTAYHQGRGGSFNSTEDIDFNHEAELTGSQRFVIATDERGGGVVPPGAACSPGIDNVDGNGGLHAYRVDALKTERPESPEEAYESYARTPEGEKAIFRTPINTGPQGSFCTAHVFQQIPGQNRIFMAWYTQGTQVIDFIENPDGTFEFEHAGFFIPSNANQWVSEIFKMQTEEDGRITYFGVSGDTLAGRAALDVYKVTLPAPQPAAQPVDPPSPDPSATPSSPPPGSPPPGSPPPGSPPPSSPPPSSRPPAQLDRLSGPSRLDTAAAISADTFETSDTVVLARADEYADALAGGPLARSLNAPLLLTSSDELSDVTRREIERLGATQAVLLGGTDALAPQVQADLTTAGVTSRRVAGSNRFATAARIAAELGASDGRAFVVEGANPDPSRGWPDAVSVAPLAAASADPILLVTADDVPDETAQALDDLGVDEVVVVGGREAVTQSTQDEAATGGRTTSRLAGTTRYETSRAVRDLALTEGAGTTALYLATGGNYPDALTAGPAVAAAGGTLLLADGADLDRSPSTRQELTDAAPELDRVVLLGGEAALSATVRDQVQEILTSSRQETASQPAAAGAPWPTQDQLLLLLALGLLPLAGLLGRTRRRRRA